MSASNEQAVRVIASSVQFQSDISLRILEQITSIDRRRLSKIRHSNDTYSDIDDSSIEVGSDTESDNELLLLN